MVERSIAILALLSALCGAASAQTLLAHEPPMGALREGDQVYVDDHTCPGGKIKLVTGGNHVLVGGTKRIRRSYACVPRPR